MRHHGSRAADPATRRAWKPPVFTIGSIRLDTKSTADKGAAPPPPGAPTSKLGFAFEMAFPLSARVE
jgi:hypothetical protein